MPFLYRSMQRKYTYKTPINYDAHLTESIYALSTLLMKARQELPCAFFPRMLDDFSRGALLEDRSAIHEDNVVCDVARKCHLVRDDDHGGFLVGKLADDVQYFPGQLGVECGGRLVKAQNVGCQCQGARDGDALALTARELVRIVLHTVGESHLPQQISCLLLDREQLFLFVRPVVGRFLREQLSGEHDILQCGVLRKQVEGLEYQTEMKAFAPDLALLSGGGIIGVKQGFPVHADDAAVRPLQEVQTAQECCLAAARGADDGDGLSLFH